MDLSIYGGNLYINGRAVNIQWRFVNGKLWAQCEDCQRWIRLNKPIFGSLHCCHMEVPDDTE